MNNDSLQRIVSFAKKLEDLRAIIAVRERELAELKAREITLSQEDIPSEFAELGLKELKLEDGSVVKINSDVSVAIPEERRGEAFAWLTENNYDGIIKTEVTVAFGKGQIEDARALRDELRTKRIDANLERSIHPQTLAAFAREQLKEGRDLPNSFSFYQYSKTSVKHPKGK